MGRMMKIIMTRYHGILRQDKTGFCGTVFCVHSQYKITQA